MTGSAARLRVAVVAPGDVSRDRPTQQIAVDVATAGDVTVVGPLPGGALRAWVQGIEVRRVVVPPPADPGVPAGPLPSAWWRRARSLRHRLPGRARRGWAAAARRYDALCAPILADVRADEVVKAVPTGLAPRATPDAAAWAALRGTVLGIGPANMAGQAWAWCRAAERRLNVQAEAFALPNPVFAQPLDIVLPPDAYARQAGWQGEWALHVRHELTHLLIEAGRPVLGTMYAHDFGRDAMALRALGLTVGLVFHGSEIRNPREHAARYPWSPFRNPRDPLTRLLQSQVDNLAPLVAYWTEQTGGQLFVSTPDLLDDLPDATWLPVVVDVEKWSPGPEPLRRDRPIVVHAPSNPALKGTALIEPVLHELEAAGRITYRRLQGVPAAEVVDVIRAADIVLDHFGIGNYGVLTCEAMATGRVSISHIADRVRARVPVPIPTLEATPDTLRDVIEDVLADRDAARATAAEGPAFVREWHDGRRSAAVLAPFLGITV